MPTGNERQKDKFRKFEIRQICLSEEIILTIPSCGLVMSETDV